MKAASNTLVTGASGFIGQRLLRPYDRALVRSASGLPNAVVGDLLNPGSLAAACQGVDTVFHCAGYAHAFASTNSDTHWRIGFEGTRNLLMAAGEAGVRRFVFLSSVKAMAEPGSSCVDEDWPGESNSSYGKAKRAAEVTVLDAGERYGMHVVNLRLAMVYGRGGQGNLERMARGIAAGWFPSLPETGNRRSLIHVDDVVEVTRLVAAQPAAKGRTYIIAGARAYSGREIYDTIRKVLGKPPARYYVPEWFLRSCGRAGDIMGLLPGHPFPLNSEIVDKLLCSACYLPDRISQELGWSAKTALTDGVMEMLGVSCRVRV
ncbi:MAG: hypothetical protein RLZZ596_1831 [Pseudomonadota bacterium]|jgi:nucleoside-diphosphate-sugar epimerase